MIAPSNSPFIIPFKNAQMLNDLNSWTKTAISNVSELPCATIREMKKRGISIIGSPRAKWLKKEMLMRTAGVLVAFSVLHSNAIVRQCNICSEWDQRKKKDKRKRMRRRKETPWRHRPETERFQMRRKREDREDERELRADGHPRCPPALPTCFTQSCESAVSQFVNRHRCATPCDMIWHEMRRSSVLLQNDMQIAEYCDILNSRICAS